MNAVLLALGAAAGSVGLAVAELAARLGPRPIPIRVDESRRRPPPGWR
jgi:hypothetical protein